MMFYDAESEIGLMPDNPDDADVMLFNRNRITNYLKNCKPGGTFVLKDGTRLSPPKRGLYLPPIEVFTRPAIRTTARTGGQFMGCGGRTVALATAAYDPASNARGGAISRLVFMSDGGDPDELPYGISLSGNGFELGKMSLFGRRWLIGGTFIGTRVDTLINMEGRGEPNGAPSGYHNLHDLTLMEASVGIRAAAGYYDDNGNWQSYEAGCDQFSVRRVSAYNVDTFFYSGNNQAVGGSFQDINYCEGYGWDGEEGTIFKIARGGDIDANNIVINHRKCYLYRQGSDDQNASSSCIGKVKWDLQADYSGMFLCLYKWDGAVTDDMSGVNACLTVGPIDWPRETSYDPSKTIQIPTGKNFPVSKLRFKFDKAPQSMLDTYFDLQSDGYYTPKAV